MKSSNSIQPYGQAQGNKTARKESFKNIPTFTNVRSHHLLKRLETLKHIEDTSSLWGKSDSKFHQEQYSVMNKMLCSLVCTNIPEEPVASIFKAEATVSF